MDYHPGDFPAKVPKVVWLWWDSCCEFMTETDDTEEGKKWMDQATRRCGYTARYELAEIAEEAECAKTESGPS